MMDMETTTLLHEVGIQPIRLDPAARSAIEGARTGIASGALLIPNMAIGHVPPTPASIEVLAKTDRTSERALLGVASMLGEPIGYAQEHGGNIVQDLFPLASSVGRQLSTSSGVELAFHTETAFHPHKPHFLLLLCLRGDPAAATTLCSVKDIVAPLSAGTLAILRQPRFRCGVDESFGPGSAHHRGPAWLTPDMPVLCEHINGSFEFTFDGELTIGIDREAEEALDEVRHAIESARTSLTLATGNLLIIDNHQAVHGRSPFTARFDGTDRWLQRTFVLDDLAPSVGERVGRVITTRFD